jgi:hypothetical protein
MVVRFVCVIRVPLCARVSRVCPVCVPCVSRLPRCLFTGTLNLDVSFRSGPLSQPGSWVGESKGVRHRRVARHTVTYNHKGNAATAPSW